MNKFYVALLLLVFSTGVLEAQNPGGVGTNLSLWLKPDGLSAGSLATWNYSNNGNSFTGAVGQQPTVTANLFNFLPGVTFNGSQFMTGPTGPGATGAPIPALQLNYSIFAVWNSAVAVAGASTNMRVWAQRANAGASGDANFDGASLFVYPSGQFQGAPYTVTPSPYGDQPETPNYTTGVSTASSSYTTAILTYTPNTTYISELNLLDQNTNDLELMDQTNYTTGPGVTSTDPAGLATTNRKLTDAGNWLGARSGAGDEPFIGNLAELIVYAGNPTPTQRSEIFSYLSLKYGVPLGGDLLSSAGTTIWNSTVASHYNGLNYNHNVFGIGEDNGSGLTLSKSNSTGTGSGSGAGQSGLGNITLANPTALTDQSFFVVGSAGQAMTETQTNITPLAAAGSFRVGNQWLAQKTGTIGNFDFSFDFSGISIQPGSTIGNSGNFRLDVDVDGDGDFTTGPQELLEPTSWSGNVATWSGIFMGSTDNTSVVFTIIDDPSAATPLPVNWVSFTGVANGPDVDLNWTVSANEQANVYEVQHSTDGTNFTTIGEVSNLPNVQSYGFVHANAGPGTHYYRINEVDHDGKSIYSKIISVNMSGSDFAIRLLNNPVTGNGQDAQLEVTAANPGNASLEVWTLSGTRIETLMQSVTSGTTTIRVPMSTLPSGTYAVKIRVNDVTQVVQIVKL